MLDDSSTGFFIICSCFCFRNPILYLCSIVSKSLKAHLALFTVALIYGANYTIAKDVLDKDYIQPLGFILMRVLSGLLLFSLIHFFFIKEKIDRKDIGKLILCGLFGVAINQMFFFMGLKFTRPINASLIMTICPIMVLIASAFLLKESITMRKLLGIFLGACGAISLMVYGEQFSFRGDQFLGDLMIFINATSYGIYLVLVKSLMKKYHPITVVKWVFTFGMLFVLPFSFNELKVVDWQSFQPQTWIAIAYVLLCTTFLAYLLNAYALKIVRASTVSIYIYLQPVLATLIAILAGSDQLLVQKVIFGLMIFAGVYLVSSKKATST